MRDIGKYQNLKKCLCVEMGEQVALASGLKYIEKVREAQLGMKMENLVCVDAMGLELQEDNLHLTTPSQVILGQMLVDAYFTHFTSP